MTKMKVLSKLKAEPGIWLDEAPIPEIGSNDVLIKVKKTAICGTDLHIYNWDAWAQKNIPVPMHVGHEFVGEIVEVGEHVNGFEIGDRVSGEGHIVCGHCRNCRDGRQHLCPNTVGVGVNRPGCFAEYLAIPARNAFKIPDEISDDVAAIFDPYGNAVHTALSFNLVGEDVIVTGAGPIGIMAALIAQHVGARHVLLTDVNEYRLNLAKNIGVKHVLNMSDCKTTEVATEKLKSVMPNMNMNEGFDVGLEMSGNDVAISSMVDTMFSGGKIALLGLAGKPLTVAWDDIILRGLYLKGIYGREMFETWYKMTTLIQGGLDIEPIITHRLNARDFQQGFDAMKLGQCGKVILDMEKF